MSFASNKLAKYWVDKLNHGSHALFALKSAQYPFSDYDNLRMRIMTSLCLGCDVYPRRHKNLGPPTLEKCIKNIGDEEVDMC